VRRLCDKRREVKGLEVDLCDVAVGGFARVEIPGHAVVGEGRNIDSKRNY
jgi:hypothetical protein